MTEILSFILSLLLLYKYWVLFFVTFISAVIVPVPVSGLFLATGAFASQGYFNFPISFIVIIVGNTLGDCFDFLIAKRYGHQVFQMMHIRIPNYFERLERFVKKYTRSTIFFSRFIGTVEPLTSLLCGFSGIKLKLFIIYALLGNIVSDGMILVLGYFLGIHWQDFINFLNIADYVFIAIAICIIIFLSMWHKRRRR